MSEEYGDHGEGKKDDTALLMTAEPRKEDVEGEKHGRDLMETLPAITADVYHGRRGPEEKALKLYI